MRFNLFASLLILAASPAVSAPESVQPGRWESSSRIMNVEAPGMPAQVVQMMTSRTTKFTHCITPEDVATGPEKMLEKSQGDTSQCKMLNHEVSGSRMKAEMQCSSKEMGNMHMAIEGDYAPTAYKITTTMRSSGGPFSKMTTSIESKRIGNC